MMDPAQSEQVVVAVRDLQKSFGATHALRGVDIDFRAGRIHALLGANGCGKSTLVKILAGYHQPDGGEVKWSTGEDRPSIAFVHQDLGLVPMLSVTENLALTRGFDMRHGVIGWQREHASADQLLRRYGIECDVRQPIGSYGPALQTMAAIARAVASLPEQGGTIVLDEPTARLPVSEADRLLGMLRSLRQRGVAIVYISHRLDEVLSIADEVTVLRDGERVFHGEIDQLDRTSLIRLIVGKDIDHQVRPDMKLDREQDDLLVVRDLSGVRLRNVSLSLGRGEVVGIAGLVGSGRSELGRIIFGLQKADSGSVFLDGQEVTNAGTETMVRLGVGYVPQERRQGLFQGLSVGENAVLADIKSLMGRFAISRTRLREASAKVVADCRIKTDGIDAAIETLSGGNQQKVSLGKWLRRDPRLLILDEPTQGIDIGARSEIFALVRNLAAERDLAVVVFDSDLDILAEYCDRVFVMARGRLVQELDAHAATPSALSRAVYEH